MNRIDRVISGARTKWWTLPAAGAISLLLHAGSFALLTGPLATMFEPGDALAHIAPSDQSDTDDQPDKRDPYQLGLVSSKAVSINWLGFADDPREHLTERESELDQAALTIDAAGAPAVVQAEPTPPVQQQEQPQPVEPTEPVEPIEPKPEPPAEQPAPEPPVPPEPAVVAVPDQPDPIKPIPLLESDPAVPQPPQPEPEPKPEPKPEQKQTPKAKPVATPRFVSSPWHPFHPPATGTTRGAGAGDRPGEQSDSDATPTSRIRTYKLEKWGRPLAGEGLEIHPVAPDIPIAQQYVLRRRRVIIDLAFDRKGHVRQAEFARLRGGGGKYAITHTGNKIIDEALIDSAYRWTAEGPPIDELGRGDTLTVRIRIVLR